MCLADECKLAYALASPTPQSLPTTLLLQTVASVDVNLEENKATVTYKAAADDDAVIALITNCKFGATKC